jgi:hypothetical protein
MCRNRASSAAANLSVSEAPVATTIRALACPWRASVRPADAGVGAVISAKRTARDVSHTDLEWGVMAAF